MEQIISQFAILVPIFMLFVTIGLVFTFFYMYINKLKGKYVNIKKFLLNMSLVFVIIGIVMVTCSPSPISNIKPRNLELIPFKDFIFSNELRINLISATLLNIVLFIPIGFIGLIFFKNGLKSFKLSITITIIIEIMQFIFPLGRSTTIDDIIFNSLGSIIGILLCKVLLRCYKAVNNK